MAQAEQKLKEQPIKKRAPVLYFIIGFKLLKGLLLLLVALGVYSLSDNNLPEEFRSLLQFLHLDPEKQFFSTLANKLSDITPTNLLWVARGTFIYSLFSLVEGIGLVFRASWAGWLAIGESAFFIPIEVRELMHQLHFSWIIFSILILNIFIVWYLWANRHRLYRHH
ncbi:DUF2127 domain-containing protein [Pedosphaera parvula]|uniref:Membrane protein-like protein n=1 Tax=Pedosphaera parvula (strain Ellin514) TaxID=320771 RepID=B9XSS7_PEDPL|nr:DUF2127 domain-containing protein [Pedosphaera parvula]EEF57094.1 membrane protein-like protein [Pedosphaera parvula Ellin514]